MNQSELLNIARGCFMKAMFFFDRECKDGRKPVYVNNKYECPDHPPCGEAPSCVTGRKGEGCSQPDVSPCDSKCNLMSVLVIVSAT